MKVGDFVKLTMRWSDGTLGPSYKALVTHSDPELSLIEVVFNNGDREGYVLDEKWKDRHIWEVLSESR